MIQDSESIAIITAKEKLTFHQLLQKAYLFGQMLDVSEGDIVIVFSKVRPAYIYALYGIWSRRAVYNTMFYNLDENFLTWAIPIIRPKAAFVSKQQLPLFEKAMEILDYSIQILILDDIEDVEITENTPIAKFNHKLNDIAAVILSAAITGKHKPIQLTYKNFLHNAKTFANTEFMTKDDRTMVLLPFYNNWILVGTVIIPLYSGGCCVICESDDIDTIIKTMNENAVTNFVCVKSIYDKILDKFLTEINSHFIGRVKYWIAEKLNSMSISQMLFSKYHKLLGGKFRYFLTVGTSIQTNIWKPLTILGFDVKEAYGMAEGTSIVTIPVSKRVNSQSVGQLIEGIKIKIINDEIVLKGPNIMYSYYNSPQLNKELLINGWLFTGDIGYIEANNELYIIGRKNEEIVFSDGRIVNPFEIESMIASYDDYIHDLGVYSSNNMLKIVIVPKPNLIELHGDSNNFETIKDIIRWNVIEYYNHTVPQFKRIKKITITDKILPKSTSGKLKRYLLSSFEVQEVDEFSELLSNSNN